VPAKGRSPARSHGFGLSVPPNSRFPARSRGLGLSVPPNSRFPARSHGFGLSVPPNSHSPARSRGFGLSVPPNSRFPARARLHVGFGVRIGQRLDLYGRLTAEGKQREGGLWKKAWVQRKGDAFARMAGAKAGGSTQQRKTGIA